MTRKPNAVFDTDRKQLATLLNLAPDTERIWRDEDLGAILRHQLSAPIQVDLINLERGLALKVRNLAESQGLVLKSFADLFQHPNPPVELLKITKDFAKACRLSPNSPLPREIASVLYFASIAAALVRCRRRITGLSNDAIREGLHWVLARHWIDAPTSKLMKACLGVLEPDKGAQA